MSRDILRPRPSRRGPAGWILHPLPGLKGLPHPRPTCLPSIFLLPLLRMVHSQWTGTFSSTNSPVAPLSFLTLRCWAAIFCDGFPRLAPQSYSAPGPPCYVCLEPQPWVPGRTSTNALSLTSSFPSSFTVQSLAWVSFTPSQRWSLTKRIACDLCPICVRHC